LSNIFQPVGMKPSEFINEVLGLVEKASKKGIVVRILGAVAVYIHSSHDPEALAIYDRTGRISGEKTLFTDLDLAAYSKQRKEIFDFFEKDMGFNYDPVMKAIYGHKRLIYFHPANLYHVDVFFDKLEFNHDVEWGSKPGKGRLELDYPTISLADIVLEKTQITRINRKDLVDLAVLFKAHDVCREESRECINGDYIASILADDWGFWYDATNNLVKLKELVNQLVSEGKISGECGKIIAERVDKLLAIINEKPKTKKWINRSKIGTSKPWYREVEEIVR